MMLITCIRKYSCNVIFSDFIASINFPCVTKYKKIMPAEYKSDLIISISLELIYLYPDIYYLSIFC